MVVAVRAGSRLGPVDETPLSTTAVTASLGHSCRPQPCCNSGMELMGSEPAKLFLASLWTYSPPALGQLVGSGVLGVTVVSLTTRTFYVLAAQYVGSWFCDQE